MNKTVAGLIALAVLTAACSQPAQKSELPGAESSAPAKSAGEIVLAVDGMTCGGCASGIEEKLSGTPGVLKCRVDFAKKEARVSIDPEKQSKSAVIAAIESLGFSAKEKN